MIYYLHRVQFCQWGRQSEAENVFFIKLSLRMKLHSRTTAKETYVICITDLLKIQGGQEKWTSKDNGLLTSGVELCTIRAQDLILFKEHLQDKNMLHF
jgi:hypothetical protein